MCHGVIGTYCFNGFYMKEDYGRYQSAANTMIRLTASDSTNSEFAKTVKEKLAPYIPAEKPQVPVQEFLK